MSREKELLRECITVILENDGDGYHNFGDYSGGGFYGGSYGGPGATRQALLNPITDVIKIIRGKIKELWAGAKYVAEFALKAVLSTLTLGLYDANYGAIHQSYLGSMSKIRSQYSRAVSDSYQSFFRNDLSTIAFFYSPGLYMLSRPIVPEGKALLEADALEVKNIKAGSSQSKAVVDEYFANLEVSLQDLSHAKMLEDLTLDPQVYAESRKKIDAIPDEKERELAEQELVRTAKLQVFTDELKRLKSERESIIKDLKASGVPLNVIMNPEGLVVRYERELRRLSSIKI